MGLIVPRFAFVIIAKRKEWSINGHKSFEITVLIISKDGSIMGDELHSAVFLEKQIIELARHGKNGNHISARDICYFIDSRRMSAIKIAGMHGQH